MEWSRPTQQGEIPTPRAGHAGVTIGENWFIVGGGDNKSGMCLITSAIKYKLVLWLISVFRHTVVHLLARFEYNTNVGLD